MTQASPTSPVSAAASMTTTTVERLLSAGTDPRRRRRRRRLGRRRPTVHVRTITPDPARRLCECPGTGYANRDSPPAAEPARLGSRGTCRHPPAFHPAGGKETHG